MPIKIQKSCWVCLRLSAQCVLCSSDFVSGSQNDTITTLRLFDLLCFAATVTGRHNFVQHTVGFDTKPSTNFLNQTLIIKKITQLNILNTEIQCFVKIGGCFRSVYRSWATVRTKSFQLKVAACKDGTYRRRYHKQSKS